MTLTSSATSLSVKSDKNSQFTTEIQPEQRLKGQPEINNIPIRQVVQAHYQQDSQILQVSYVWRKKAKGPSSLVRLEGKVQGELTTASEWAESVTKAAYEGSWLVCIRFASTNITPRPRS